MKVMFAILLALSLKAQATSPGFQNLDESDFKDIIHDFSAALFHTSVSPASALGNIWGFEVGVIAGAAKADAVDKFSKEVNANSSVPALPHAGILGVLTFPFGITGEINFLPEVNNADLEFATQSAALKWTFSSLWDSPVDLAVKLEGSSSSIKWNQPISSVLTDVKYEQKSSGLIFQVSKKLTIFEPYFSLGAARSKGELSVLGSGSVFDSTYTTSQNSSADITGNLVMAGFNLNLAFIKLGLEVGKVFEATKGSAKFSLYF